jgi:hypothetical protein
MGEGELVGVTEKLKCIAQFVRKEMEEYRELICGELNCKGGTTDKMECIVYFIRSVMKRDKVLHWK